MDDDRLRLIFPPDCHLHHCRDTVLQNSEKHLIQSISKRNEGRKRNDVGDSQLETVKQLLYIKQELSVCELVNYRRKSIDIHFENMLASRD